MSDIAMKELAQASGLSLSHLNKLIKRGILPEGRKEGRTRYLPRVEALLTLASHKENEHWPKARTRHEGYKATPPIYCKDHNDAKCDGCEHDKPADPWAALI